MRHEDDTTGIALVCKYLATIDWWNVEEKVKEFPPELDGVYKA